MNITCNYSLAMYILTRLPLIKLWFSIDVYYLKRDECGCNVYVYIAYNYSLAKDILTYVPLGSYGFP